ncbi:hypothetical protein MLD52_12310 [Puniceicoccaceae bacterium K14]|nr:hypothetical protein [Puniceicoccaceae bacterium K14]
MAITQKSAIGSSPGKLNFLGGLVTFEGSHALHAQTESKTTVLATVSSSTTLELSNAHKGKFSTDIDSLSELCRSHASPEAFRMWLEQKQAPDWTHFSIGALYTVSQKFQWFPDSGISFAISTDIPIDIGFNYSVSVEIATLRALEKLSSNYFMEQELAKASHEIELELLDRPCPIETPLTCAYGKPGSILPLEGKYSKIRTAIDLPKGIILAACTLSAANEVQLKKLCVAADMGMAIYEKSANHETEYNSKISTSLFSRTIAEYLPEEISGSDFKDRYGEFQQAHIKLDPNTVYPVKAATKFAIQENDHSRLSMHMLSNMIHNAKRKSIELVGELMLQSYEQSKTLGFTSESTDNAIEILTQIGASKGVYGARINHGFAKSSLVILLERSSLKIVRNSLNQGSELDVGEPVLVIQ